MDYDASGGGSGVGGPTGGSFSTGGLSSTGLTGGQAYSEGGRAFGQDSPFSGISGLGTNTLGVLGQMGLTAAGMAAPVGITGPLTMAQTLENALNLGGKLGLNFDPTIDQSLVSTQLGAGNTGAMGVSGTGVGYGGLGQSPGVSGVGPTGALSQGLFGGGVPSGGVATGRAAEADLGEAAAPSISEAALGELGMNTEGMGLGQSSNSSAGTGTAAGPGSTAAGGIAGTAGVGQANDAQTSDAAGGAGGAGAGDKIICTALHDMGLMPDYIYAKDKEFAAHLDPIVYAGYICWARHVATALRRVPILAVAVRPIVMCWAREMAGEHNFIGKIMMRVGMRVCKYIGVRRLQRAWVSR